MKFKYDSIDSSPIAPVLSHDCSIDMMHVVTVKNITFEPQESKVFSLGTSFKCTKFSCIKFFPNNSGEFMFALIPKIDDNNIFFNAYIRVTNITRNNASLEAGAIVGEIKVIDGHLEYSES